MSTTDLEALAGELTTRGLVAELTRDGLRVSNPKVVGCCGSHPGTVITCRDSVGGRSWFHTSWGEAPAPVTRPVDAVRAVRRWLSRTPDQTPSVVLA
ncbi:hypothetical protein GCM10009678_07460 [Actinomadura kijaniata]|uniref:Uncharacterized protein n=1 Tax=Actinomadura namibiensis TaxID=182080 RepID=A0A7W3LLE7_ACTNM|nr:hypothetical protein [Actinomadura namibiensis]MBA8950287.1 hypothetical protein [Actinomadura namibiensis]